MKTLVYKHCVINFVEGKSSNSYEVAFNGVTLKTISFKKNNVTAINKALSQAKQYINNEVLT